MMMLIDAVMWAAASGLLFWTMMVALFKGRPWDG